MGGKTAAIWTWNKAIPEQRDRVQSRWLTLSVGSLLVLGALPIMGRAILPGSYDSPISRSAAIISVVFGALVVLLRAATGPAALCGSLVCLSVVASFSPLGGDLLRSGLTPLLALFVMTFLATRVGRLKGAVHEDLQEVRKGRRASQVIANLGLAGLAGWLQFMSHPYPMVFDHKGPDSFLLSRVVLIALLAESTADTVASELGQAFGGQPRMLTSWQCVEPGTDGAVTLSGTAVGVAAAAMVVASGMWALHLPLPAALCGLAGGVGGLFFDSVLGATVERRGWFGNDLVNFSSTAFAGLLAALLLALA